MLIGCETHEVRPCHFRRLISKQDRTIKSVIKLLHFDKTLFLNTGKDGEERWHPSDEPSEVWDDRRHGVPDIPKRSIRFVQPENTLRQPLYIRKFLRLIKPSLTYVWLRLRVQNRRTKWHFPPYFQNGIIWNAPFPLNIHNGIIWGGAFPKHLGLQKHLFWYSLKMPACALGLQKHLFWYSLKMPACALGLQKHLFRYSLKMPACMIIFKILLIQKHCTLYLYSNGHV